MIGSAARTPNSRPSSALPAAISSDDANRQADGAQPQDLTEDEPDHVAPLRADGETDADLLRARADRVRHHAVDPDGREDQRDACEDGQQHRRDPLLERVAASASSSV